MNPRKALREIFNTLSGRYGREARADAGVAAGYAGIGLMGTAVMVSAIVTSGPLGLMFIGAATTGLFLAAAFERAAKTRGSIKAFKKENGLNL